MFYVKYLFYFILLHSIISAPLLNLYYTDWISDSQNENDTTLQHNCLHVPINTYFISNNHEVVTYCLSELPSKFNVTSNSYFSNFTFDELSKQNISSEHLYLWSTPIDIIERYQYYLNQLSTENDSSLHKQIYYNCTLPRFGPMCQYQLYYYEPYHRSLYDMINYFYTRYRSDSTNLTCYKHLECDRGPSPSCLDWTEICDGKVDCLDGNFDEEHCWELEINQCKDNEYRCMNGECIPQTFYDNANGNLDCIDGSDINRIYRNNYEYTCNLGPPAFICDDMKCDSTHLTSSCLSDRRELLLEAMYSIKNKSVVSEDCWSVLKCMFFVLESELSSCYDFCEDNSCLNIVEDTCPDMLFFPNVPILFGHIYLAFKKSNSTNEDIGLLYICYNNSHYDAFFDITTELLFNNTRCFLHNTISYSWNRWDLWAATDNTSLQVLYNQLKKYQLMFNYTSLICNRSNMYQCLNSSKCISIHRLMDGLDDCPYLDDENKSEMNNTEVIKQLEQTHMKCQTSKKYIHKTIIEKRSCECDYIGYEWCYDKVKGYKYEKRVLFQATCDGFVELTPAIINGQNQTDETECEPWECDNRNTHCNGIWNCPTGRDEINCESRPPSNCSLDNHICVSPQTNQFICLSNDKINDGQIDCLGAYDEPQMCQMKSVAYDDINNFYCMQETTESCISPSQLCNGIKECDHGDDEQFCKPNRTGFGSICWNLHSPSISDVERFLCRHSKRQIKPPIGPSMGKKMNTLSRDVPKNIKNTIVSSSSVIQMSNQYERRCYRGIDLYVWSGDKKTMTCLCPPSYYGPQCQYQNQRISLSIQFRALSHSYQTLFAIIISLIDNSDQRIVHSFVQISYLSARDCENKYGFYLVYSTRPKDPTKTYSIHIDIYERDKLLTYRGSLLLPIQFPFLPVHRLGFLVDIPKTDKTQSCSKNPCHHGKCIRYSNTQEETTFCQCEQGWSGKLCTIKHTCTCTPDSICIGISANNQSICVCPKNKFGSRCFLTDTTCDNNSICENGGRCIPDDNFIKFNKPFRCVFLQGFSETRCQRTDNKLILSFNNDIVVPQTIFIHFLDLENPDRPKRSTTFETILTKQDSVTIYRSQEFYRAFLELLNKNYYLIINENNSNRSTTIEKLVNSSDRCPNINELLNKTIVQLDLIRRIKYYQLPCQMYSPDLNCFYDEVHLCLCYNFGKKRLADCVEFDHNMKFDCIGQSECENGGECFQDNQTCPSRSICRCLSCYYGRRCQFSTSGFGLSLDTILGYQILPNLNIENQSTIIKFSLSLTIIFILIGLIDGFICIITFKNKVICEVGCGLYLLISSITTILIMIIFGLKFFILLFTQMRNISNESFLLFQCHSIDFILRICLSMDQWLNACVAVERTMVIIKGTNFTKKKSREAAKFFIIILLIVITGSYIHDPIYRRLIDEENDDDHEKRIWCIVSYPPYLEVYNYIIHILHFFGPFSINLVSSIILIIKTSRQQSKIHEKRPYKDILREQLRLHRHLLIGPIVLVILSFPRLIITFVSKCMKSADDAWLFLIGYFISFIPSMINSIVFILPSEFYRKECHKTILEYRTIIQRHLHLTR